MPFDSYIDIFLNRFTDVPRRMSGESKFTCDLGDTARKFLNEKFPLLQNLETYFDLRSYHLVPSRLSLFAKPFIYSLKIHYKKYKYIICIFLSVGSVFQDVEEACFVS